MADEISNERCPRCGSHLGCDAVLYWCSSETCTFGLDKKIDKIALDIIKARGGNESLFGPLSWDAPKQFLVVNMQSGFPRLFDTEQEALAFINTETQRGASPLLFAETRGLYCRDPGQLFMRPPIKLG